MTSYLYPYIQETSNFVHKCLNVYNLSIRYSADAFSFVIFDTEEQKFIGLKQYRCSEKNIPLQSLLLELQERENWNLKDFNSVKILIDNNINTLIPQEFYDDSLKKEYMSLLNSDSENHIQADFIESINVYNVYQNKDRTEYKTVHTSTVLIENLIKEFSERKEETRVFVNVKDNSYELIIIDGEKLLFHNYFNFYTKEDFLYFILFTFEQHRIDNESVPLYFMGFIEEKSSIVELCSRYIRNIRFIKKDNNYSYISELDSIPYYYYHILYSSATCE